LSIDEALVISVPDFTSEVETDKSFADSEKEENNKEATMNCLIRLIFRLNNGAKLCHSKRSNKLNVTSIGEKFNSR
jgi:hypothetical protein